MIYISKDRQIHVVWSIFRGTSDVHEDFSRALVKVFLIGNYEKYLLEAVAEGGNLVFDIPQGLPEGAYSLEAIWVKNYNNLLPSSDTLTPSVDSGCRNQPLRWPFKHPHDHRFNDRCIMRSRKDYVFALTEYDSESTFYKDSEEAEIKIRSAVATYGYDGLSAYEIAVLRGDFNGTEGEYLDSLKFKLEVAQEHKLGGITAVTKTDDETEEVKVDPETGRLYVKPGGGSLSVATETKLGGIKAATKTSLETQEVKIDPVTGKLYTQPGGEGGVEIVNNPDEEDLHSVEQSADVHVLQFADKEHNASSFSGLGRVYLRKNISDGKNVLTQAMMNKANTRYIIQYDYDLDQQEIELPNNCILEFQGGSLKNGVIIGNGSLILSTPFTYIFQNITFKGDFRNSCFYADWFGCADVEDCSDNLQWAIDSAQSVLVKSVTLSNKIYNISKTIKIPSFFEFGGIPNRALSVWKRVGTISLIYQTSNLPIIELGDSTDGARNISLHDVSLQPVTDYQGPKNNLYGIYVNSTTFANNFLNNVWANGCKYGMYVRISNGGGFTENRCINLCLTRSIVGMVVENQDVGTPTRLWMNHNYFELCYFNENTCGGVWINSRSSFQTNVFQSCNFENIGKDYTEEDYNEYGCFAFKCLASFGIVVFDSCYVENIFPIKDNVLRTEINYNKESGFILGALNAILRNNVISGMRQFVNIAAAAKLIKLQNNDYYLTKRDNNTSDALIRITDISDNKTFAIDITENKFSSSSVIKKPYILDVSSLSSTKSLYQSNININCPSFPLERFSNIDYGESFTLYIDSSKGNKDYSGLSMNTPFANLNQIFSYGTTRYKNAKNITIDLQTDTTLSSSLDREIFQGLNLRIKGNNQKITLSNYQIPLVDCKITFENLTIEINNTIGYYSVFQVFGKVNLCFNNCTIIFKNMQSAYFIRSYSGADCYVDFVNSEMNKAEGTIYSVFKGPESNVRVRKRNFTASGILEVSDTNLSEDALNYTTYANLNFTRLADKKHYVYADDDGNFHNSDGTLTSKVKII